MKEKELTYSLRGAQSGFGVGRVLKKKKLGYKMWGIDWSPGKINDNLIFYYPRSISFFDNIIFANHHFSKAGSIN